MLVAVRKVMEKIFTLHELEVLDDLMPESIKKKKAEHDAAHKKDDDYEYDEGDDECCEDGVDGKKVKSDWLDYLALLKRLQLYYVQNANMLYGIGISGVGSRI